VPVVNSCYRSLPGLVLDLSFVILSSCDVVTFAQQKI